MTIHVEKLIERSWPNKSEITSDAGKDSMYRIELSALELEHLRDVLRFVPSGLQAKHFADKCADIMTAALVSNGE